MATANSNGGAVAAVAAVAAAAAAAPAVAATVAVLAGWAGTLTLAYRRAHTRGNKAYVTYGLAGVPGVAFFASSMLAKGAVWPTTLTLANTGAPNLHYSGTAACGRYNYRVPGVPGTLQIANAWLGTVPPATLCLTGVALATPTVATGAAATSAVVAAANVAVAANTGNVATPTAVAATAGKLAGKLVAASNKAHTVGK